MADFGWKASGICDWPAAHHPDGSSALEYAVYSDMLAHLTLLPKHGENLLERGLSEERIRRNEYRSMPETERGRRLLTDLLRSHGRDCAGGRSKADAEICHPAPAAIRGCM